MSEPTKIMTIIFYDGKLPEISIDGPLKMGQIHKSIRKLPKMIYAERGRLNARNRAKEIVNVAREPDHPTPLPDHPHETEIEQPADVKSMLNELQKDLHDGRRKSK